MLKPVITNLQTQLKKTETWTCPLQLALTSPGPLQTNIFIQICTNIWAHARRYFHTNISTIWAPPQKTGKVYKVYRPGKDGDCIHIPLFAPSPMLVNFHAKQG